MKNKIFTIFLIIFYALVVFYLIMFGKTFIDEKLIAKDTTQETVETDEEKEEFEIHADTTAEEVVEEYGNQAKNFWEKAVYSVKKFFTSNRDGRNLFEITHENIFNLITGRKKKEPEVTNPEEDNSDVIIDTDTELEE